nr:hypothetical protein [Tanacetum cinerariifolium]
MDWNALQDLFCSSSLLKIDFCGLDFPNLPGQKFVDPPFEEEILAFIRKLGHSRDIKTLPDVKMILYVNLVKHLEPLSTNVLVEPNDYKTYYAFASEEEIPNLKYARPSTMEKTVQLPKASPSQKLKTTTKVAKYGKKKLPATVPKAKGLETLSEVALSKAKQIKLATKKSKKYFYMSHASGSGDGVYFHSKTFSQDEDDADEETDVNDDNEETKSDNDGDDLTHPNLSTYKADDKEEEKEEKENDDEVSSDHRVYIPPDHQLTDEDENQEGDDEIKEGKEEQEEEEEEELYGDLNNNLQRSDGEMIDAQQENVQANQVTEDTHVILSTTPLAVQHQSSSVSSDLVSKFINPSPNTGIDSILSPNIQFETLVNVPVFVAAETPSYDTTIPQPPIPNIQHLQQTPESITTTIPTTSLPDIPNFASLFQFDQRIEKYVTESLGAEVLVRSTNQPQTSYVVAASLTEFKLKKILINKIEENQSVNILDIQKNLYNALVESYNSNKDIFSSYRDVVTLKRCRDDQNKEEDPSAGSNQGSKRRRSGKEAGSLKELTHKNSKSTSSLKDASRSLPKSLGKSTHAEEHGQKVDDLEDQSHQEFNTGNDDETFVREALDVDEYQWNPLSSPTPDHKWQKTKILDNQAPQPWIT